MDSSPRILIVDDEAAIRYAFTQFFGDAGWDVTAVGNGAAALAAVTTGQRFDVIFLDVKLPDSDGLELLPRLRKFAQDTPVVVMTAYGSLETAVRAADERILDYLIKPVDLDRAAQLAALTLPPPQAMAVPPPDPPAPAADELIGLSRAMQEVYRCIGMVSRTDATVLITGETGTGKEMVARRIHATSGRRGGSFVAVNCGALPEALVESELFGHMKGTFTGANADRAGRFEAASGGTLFLDEVGELPATVQVKLLRFLDNHVIERLGSVTPLPVDVRILAATNRDLGEALRTGRFRADLYFRLAVMRVALPPLRERKEDIPDLVAAFLRQSHPNCAPPRLGAGVLERLTAYHWPGNVRELRNVVQHATIMARGGRIGLPHLPPPLDGEAPPPRCAAEAQTALVHAYLDGFDFRAGSALDEALAPIEKALTARALARFHGNRSAAAAFLGVHRNTLRKRLS